VCGVELDRGRKHGRGTGGSSEVPGQRLRAGRASLSAHRRTLNDPAPAAPAPPGYSLPLSGFLFRAPGGKRRLTMNLCTPLEDVFVEDMTVKVGVSGHVMYSTACLCYEHTAHYG
jgi:hypothetical protein